MTQPFQTGTVVYLRVGSPPMIVTALRRSDGLVTAEWFDGLTLHREAFHAECLFAETPELEHRRHQCLNRMRGLLDSSASVLVQVGDRAPEPVDG